MSGPFLGMSLGLLGCDSLVGSKRSWPCRVEKGGPLSIRVEQRRLGRHCSEGWMVSLTSCVLANSLVLGKQVK